MKTAAALLLAAIALAGCSTFPRAGPTVAEVTPQPGQDIVVIEIGMGTPSGMPADHVSPEVWTISDGPPRDGGVQAGDLLEITVFEVGYSLFSGSGALSPSQVQSGSGGSAATFPAIRVPEDGVIGLPYAGRFSVLGMSGSEIARRFEARLDGQSQNAQVVVSVEASPRQSVVVSGDIKEPGRIALTEDNERLLDAVALAGGPVARPEDTLVTVSRDGIESSVRLTELGVTSAANVRLAAGDRIELSRQVRSLTALGAATTVSEITFDEAEMTLSEALARAGGPNAQRADPTGVFIFRLEAQADGAGQTAVQPVIYRLDLLDPASYFAAQQFAMREKDVMLIADARGNRIEEFLRLVNALAAPIVTIDVLTR